MQPLHRYARSGSSPRRFPREAHKPQFGTLTLRPRLPACPNAALGGVLPEADDLDITRNVNRQCAAIPCYD